MESKEYIKKQIQNFGAALKSDDFLELAEYEHSLIILDVALNDYALSEIARLVEDNNARIFSLEVLPLKDGVSLLVSLKMDITDISAVLRSFERYSYKIVYSYMKEDGRHDNYEDRLNELMHYLDM